MAKDTYKKRMKGNWHQGKRYKGDSEERQHALREIAQALREDEEGYLEKHHKGARTRNVQARLQYRIKWYRQVLQRYDERGMDSSFASHLRHSLRKAEKEYIERFGTKP